jgi:hypothetical protein
MRIVIDPDALTALLMGAKLHIPKSALEGLYRERGDIIIHLSDEAVSMAHGTMGVPDDSEVH